MKKNISVLVLCVLVTSLLFSLFPLMLRGQQAADESVEAPLNPEFVKFINRLKAGDRPVYDSRNGTSMAKTPVNLAHVNGTGNLHRFSGRSYPSSFDLRQNNKTTPVRDQGNCGASWAFASLASLESYLKPSENLDFSEMHIIRNHGFDYGECQTGNPWMTAAYLARWGGPIYESDMAYQYRSGTNGTTLQVRKHVQQMMFLPDRSDGLDNNYIKYFLSNDGAVFGRLDWDSDFYESSSASYYCSQDTEYCLRVAIVGWDDNFSRQNFKNTPPGDGAFIAKASYGKWWGDNGYIYISYYDTGLAQLAIFNNAEPNTNYSYIYQYDHLGWTNSRGYSGSTTAWGANVFTASDNQSLKAVSFYTTDSGAGYTIHIYKDLWGTRPDEGTLVASLNGKKDYPGYYTEKLGSPILISNGERFSVVIKFTNSSYTYPIATEQPIENFSSLATAEPGQSFISESGQSWYDLDRENLNINVCIKAFTDRVGGVSLPEAPSFGSFDTPANGSTVRGSVAVTGWALDSSGIASVKIYRWSGGGLTYIGDAQLVEGARPDVAAAYPDYPGNTRAGWGYMLLSNFLPDKGNGTFELHAVAVDSGGRETNLGSKTIYCDNAHATNPFGAIDTPKPGGTVSGVYRVWGWVLTPQPNKIPVDGSTIRVRIDGKDVGHVNYNRYRSDIAGFFPGYANTGGSSGYFDLDTTRLDNDRHTIEWLVTDNGGNTEGIGSRFFNVSNGNTGTGENLDDGLVEYTGEFEEPCNIQYVQNGKAFEVRAFPGQVIVFFKGTPTEESAHDLIQSKGGYMLGQIPALGYYFVGIDIGREGDFIEAIAADSRIWIAKPHIAGSLHGAIAIDSFYRKDPNKRSHGEQVVWTLVEDCGGKWLAEPFSIDAFNEDRVRDDCIKYFLEAHGLVSKLTQNKKEPLLVNISSGFQPAIKCTDWDTIDVENTRKRLKNGWKNFMETTLAGISKLVKKKSELSNDVVFTLSAGNFNMPIDDLLDEIREDDDMAEVLDKHVLIVTTKQDIQCKNDVDQTIKMKANGNDSKDRAVAVMNNNKAAGGTSFAAPCAMGYIQQVMALENVSATEALEKVKDAIADNRNHELLLNEVLEEEYTFEGTYNLSYNIVGGCKFTTEGEDFKITLDFVNKQLTYTLSEFPFQYDKETCETKNPGENTSNPYKMKISGENITYDLPNNKRKLNASLNGDTLKGEISYEGYVDGQLHKVKVTFTAEKQSSWWRY